MKTFETPIAGMSKRSAEKKVAEEQTLISIEPEELSEVACRADRPWTREHWWQYASFRG